MKWLKDTAAEELMDSLEIEYEYKTHIPISKLRIEESKNNNARFGDPIDEVHTLTMACAMTEGRSFPGLVLTPSFLILAGNNRVESCQLAGIKYVDAYVINATTTKDTQDEFCRRDNIRHGKLNTPEERIEHCVELHAANPQKYTLKSLRDQFCGRSDSMYAKLTTAWEARVVLAALTEERFDVAKSKLGAGARAKLHTLKNNRKELVAAARTASKCRLNDSQIAALVVGIKAEPNEAAKIKYIEMYEKEHTKRSRTSKIATRFKHSLTQLHNFLHNKGNPFSSLAEIGISDPEEVKRMEKIIGDLGLLLKGIKRGERERRRGRK